MEIAAMITALILAAMIGQAPQPDPPAKAEAKPAAAKDQAVPLAFRPGQEAFVVSPHNEVYTLRTIDPRAVIRFVAAGRLRDRDEPEREGEEIPDPTMMDLMREGHVVVLLSGTCVRISEARYSPPINDVDPKLPVYKVLVTDRESNARNRSYWVFEPSLAQLAPELAPLRRLDRVWRYHRQRNPDLPRLQVPAVGSVLFLYDKGGTRPKGYPAFSTKDALRIYAEGGLRKDERLAEAASEDEYLLHTFLKVRVLQYSTVSLSRYPDFLVCRIQSLEGPTMGRSFWVKDDWVHPLPLHFARLPFERRTALWDSITDDLLEEPEGAGEGDRDGPKPQRRPRR
jgi:hypothetical protein